MASAGGWLVQVGGGWLEGPGEAVGEGGLVATTGHHCLVPGGGKSYSGEGGSGLYHYWPVEKWMGPFNGNLL